MWLYIICVIICFGLTCSMFIFDFGIGEGEFKIGELLICLGISLFPLVNAIIPMIIVFVALFEWCKRRNIFEIIIFKRK